MPVNQRARGVRQLRGGLALCLAVLLAVMPLAQLLPIVGPQAALAASAPSWASDGTFPRGEEPALGLENDRPDAGILPRLLQLEGALAPPAQKPLLPKPQASIDPPTPQKANPENVADAGFHRSSVGTARTPTGPPA